ncbi:MAG: hypothetical protein MI702_13765 [Chlorobiales bacterium]|nr:hypothetical protein [Chlorobiales bacterium]
MKDIESIAKQTVSQFCASFVSIMYSDVLKKRYLSIRETIEALNHASIWVIIFTFAILIASLVSVAVKVTFFYNNTQPTISYVLSDAHLFVIFCLSFVVLIILYMRLYVYIKKIESLSDIKYDQMIDDGDEKESQNVIFVDYYDATIAYNNELFRKGLIRLPFLIMFVVIMFLIGHDYEIYSISYYVFHGELLLPSIIFIVAIILIIEAPIWYVYGLLNMFFDLDKEKKLVEPMMENDQKKNIWQKIKIKLKNFKERML